MKPIRTLIVCLALIGLVLAACGGGGSAPSAPPAQPAPSGDAAKGKSLFEGTCAACHGQNAKGMPGLGKDLTISEFAKGKSDSDLVAFIKVGRPVSDPLNTTGVEMPARGGNASLTDQDLFDIVAYLRTLE